MIKIKILLFIILIQNCFSQVNLVSNGGFETYTQCPVSFSEINSAVPWESANGASPDFYHFCSSTFNPNLIYGPQTTHNGNGIGAIGAFYNYSGYTNSREYLKIRLNDTLVSMKKYYIEYFVSLAEKSNYSISLFGCLLTDSNYYQNDNLLINATPQITNNSGFLNIKNYWVKISGTYTALGGEQYIVLGNFKDDNNSDTTFVGGSTINNAYYFIDDVSVIDSSAIGINEINTTATNITIYPNPSNGNIQIDLSKLNENGNLQFVVYNTLGVAIKK